MVVGEERERRLLSTRASVLLAPCFEPTSFVLVCVTAERILTLKSVQA